jgi:hypothetical protein
MFAFIDGDGNIVYEKIEEEEEVKDADDDEEEEEEEKDEERDKGGVKADEEDDGRARENETEGRRPVFNLDGIPCKTLSPTSQAHVSERRNRSSRGKSLELNPCLA